MAKHSFRLLAHNWIRLHGCNVKATRRYADGHQRLTRKSVGGAKLAKTMRAKAQRERK